MILADANIWIDFFRSREPRLRSLLAKNQVVMHPYLVAELALGSLRDRLVTLSKLDDLPKARVANLRDVRQMIEARHLYSRGIGLRDAHLIAACLLTPSTELWTRDNALQSAALQSGVHVYKVPPAAE